MKISVFIQAQKDILGEDVYNHLIKVSTPSMASAMAAVKCFMEKLPESEATENLRKGMFIINGGGYLEQD